MMFGLFGSKPDKTLQDVFLGWGSYSIKVSKEYLASTDEEQGTVTIYPKGDECITLRIDVLSFEPKDESLEQTIGYDYVVGNAGDKKLSFEKDMAIAYEEKKTVEDGTNLLMKFWEIGPNDNKLIIMSATVLEKLQNDKRVKSLLASIPEMIKSIESTKVEASIETSSGVVSYTTTRQEPGDQKILQLNDDEKKFIAEWISNGENIVLYYKPGLQKNDLTFETLDVVFEDWLSDENENRFDEDSIANGLGVLFGEQLAKELDMSWVKVIDELGEELGIRHENSFTSFPISSVRKRIESGDTGFFMNIYEMLKHSLHSND